METDRSKKGFTLIELIVVIAILAILAVVAMVGFTKLREESQKRVCETNATILSRCYAAQRAISSGESEEESLQKVLDENATIACPGGSQYEVKISGERLVIICPVHGTVSSGYQYLYGENVSKRLRETIHKLIEDGVITATATIDSAAIEKEGSRAAEVEAALHEAGFTSDGTVWSVSGTDTGQVGVFWSETPLPEKTKAGDQVLVIRYNSVKNTYTVGYTKVVTREGSYLALDSNLNSPSFSEYKGATAQTDATKKDFAATYEIYKEALAAQGTS